MSEMEDLDFDQALDVCLDHMQAGDDPQDCLSSRPAYAERLDPLLRVAALLRTPDGPAMSADGLEAGRSRFLARAAQLRARRERRPASPFSGWLGGLRRLAWLAVASLLLLSILLSAGTVSAASTSLPGSPLYPVKRATESLVSSVAFTPQLQARAHLAWADRRLWEIEAVVARDGLADESLLEALEQETGRALSAAEQAGVESLQAALVHTEKQQAVLSRVLDKAPLAARPGLERALEASAQGHARARFALEQAGQPGPPGTPPGQAGDKKPPHSQREDLTAPPVPSATEDVPDDSPGKDRGGPPDKANPGRDGDDQKPGRGRGQDKIKEPGPGQGQGQGKPDDPGQGQGQDKPDNPGQGRGQGSGQGEPGSSGQGGKPGNDTPPGQDHRRDKPDNPGKGGDKHR